MSRNNIAKQLYSPPPKKKVQEKLDLYVPEPLYWPDADI